MSGGPEDLSEVPEGTAVAAEYVLGLLDADARRAAEARMEAERAFAAEVSAWWERLSPLIEAAPEQRPSDAVWARIEAAIAAAAAKAAPAAPPAAEVPSSRAVPMGMEDAQPRRRRGGEPQARRRGGAGGLLAAAMAGALAASTATFAVFAYRGIMPETVLTPQPAPDAPLMIATLSPAEGGEALYVATFDPGRRMVLVTPARVLPEAEDRSRELWVIPAGGAPYSLGLLRPGQASAMPIDPQAMGMTRSGSTLAISLEPSGGSPGPGPTGPVLGAGALAQVG